MHWHLPERRRSRLRFRRTRRMSSTCETFESRHLLAAAPVGIAFDMHYGEGGAAPLPLGLDYGFDVAADASGRLLFAGGGGLARVTDAGVDDPAFGDNGHVASPWPGNAQFAWWNALLVTAGDKAVVGGTLLYPADASRRTPVLARYADDGIPDGTFGPGSGPDRGVVYLFFKGLESATADGGSVLDVAMLPDGSYLAAGFVRYDDRPADPQDLALWKVLPDGTPDPSFGDGGLRVHDLSDGSEAV